jgi:hypothetical protein
MIASETRPVRLQHVLAQRSAESMILLNPQSGHYYTLDEIGARIWDLCDGTRCVDDVVTSIHAEYDAPVATIRSDVLEILADLAHENLVETAA